jgi:hypothetical protein
MTDVPVPAAWYPDPTGRHDHRYWDGTRWTEHIADLGVAATEPYDGPAVPPQPEPEPEPEAEPEDDPTAAWATIPVEEAEPATAATRTAGGRRGSRRLIVLIALAALVAIVVVIVLLATGSNDRDSRTSAGRALSGQLAGRLRSANGFSPKDADCVSDYMVDHLGTTRLKGVDLTGEQVPSALQSDFAKALGDGIVSCKVRSPGGTSDGGAPALPNPEDEASTKQLLMSFYELRLGLNPTQAQCLADQMFALLQSGKATLGNATEQIPTAAKSCNIPPSALDNLSHS